MTYITIRLGSHESIVLCQKGNAESIIQSWIRKGWKAEERK